MFITRTCFRDERRFSPFIKQDDLIFCVSFYTFVFFIQFNVPCKIISLIETSQSIGGAKREYPGKTT